ncbi:phenylalanine--tRNA ligase subunit alpha [Fervidicoccus fontis]|uniref:Phenylalanine--tRNA ligase alpha subunit n=1 Tax=Fervidicoccus fontis TaxID=683846 RepID=A0A843AHD4_9CREN|nr:phenylalanine--tRNA ligase subunit alpha [Fervidicoccus fontis]MBE9390999.1 phenylalanine--tRNA ligase subunit alpha [Fervidicoccus fontis]
MESKYELSDNEQKVVKFLADKNEVFSIEELASGCNIPISTANAVVELLKSKGLVREEVNYKIQYKLTEEGKKVLEKGFPEEALLDALREKQEIDMKELEKNIDRKILPIALAAGKKRGLIDIKNGKVKLIPEKVEELKKDKEILLKIERSESVEGFKERIEILIKRGLIEKKILKERKIKPEAKKIKEVLEKGESVVSKITSSIIVSGKWREVKFKEYNVEAEPPKVYPGIQHFYSKFIEKIKMILLELGFKEVYGSIIEQEFWNFDVLFQAQDHPSREIHDTFWIDKEVKEIFARKELIEKTREVHEYGGKTGSIGWRYKWDQEVAKRLILRTQTTVVSGRTLSLRPEAPFRFFTIGKVFRPDVIDARHLPEFYQFDAIISEKDMSFSKFLGMLKLFFKKMGFEELIFKPAYFPFTEPSVEGYVKIGNLGYVEVFGAGMFRPEVLEIFDIKHPVGAWGMGLDRLAMALLNLSDIRMLYDRNLENLRNSYSNALKYLNY